MQAGGNASRKGSEVKTNSNLCKVIVKKFSLLRALSSKTPSQGETEHRCFAHATQGRIQLSSPGNGLVHLFHL